MVFRRKKSIPLPYNRQAYIFYHCLNYERLAEEQRHLIDQLCVEVGGAHYQALREFVTRGVGFTVIRQHDPGIYEKGGNFYPLVCAFYMKLDKRL